MLKLRSLALSAVVAFAFAVVGCGGGGNPQKTLEEAQEQIAALEAKGVPPTELSMAKVHLSNARDNLEKRNNQQAKKNIEDLKSVIEQAEKFYTEQVATLGPKIEAAKSTVIKAKEELSGYQARKIDSTLAVIDSFARIDRPMQANDAAQALVALLPSLREDEAKAKNMRRLVPGTWVYLDTVQSVEFPKKDAAITRKEFRFAPNGKVELIESKKGQSGPYFKEDWLFRSWGTYGYKGDTVMLSIDRFKAERQMFERYHLAEKEWKKEPGPVYDSLIKDGSQDRHIVYSDLKEDFRKSR